MPERAGRPMLGLIRLLLEAYRLFARTLAPTACRYYPSCSHYAEEALATHGLGRGALLALRRLLRCHPLAPGGYDPVPLRRD